MNILQTQHEICDEVKHVIKQYTMKHSYRSDDSFNIPCEWITVDKLLTCSELKDYNESSIIQAVNILAEKTNVCLHVSGTKLRYNKD